MSEMRNGNLTLEFEIGGRAPGHGKEPLIAVSGGPFSACSFWPKCGNGIPCEIRIMTTHQAVKRSVPSNRSAVHWASLCGLKKTSCVWSSSAAWGSLKSLLLSLIRSGKVSRSVGGVTPFQPRIPLPDIDSHHELRCAFLAWYRSMLRSRISRRSPTFSGSD